MNRERKNPFAKLTAKTFLKAVFVFVLASISVGFITNLISQKSSKREPEVKQSVTISGNVKVERISFTVYPEKRVPVTGNWSTEMEVTVRPAGSPTIVLQRTGLVTNSSGLGVIDLTPSETITPGNYDFSIKGISHLRRNYDNYSITKVYEYFDFSLTGKKLLAGDTGIVVDNYVNSLDISTVVKNFYTGIVKEDLNRDSIVNSLDLSIQIANLYQTGDS